MTPRRRLATTVLCLGAAATLVACGKSPETSPDQELPGEGTLGTATVTATTEAPPPPPEYPGTARAYAEAVLAAWDATDVDRLGDLSTPEVQEQLMEVPMPIDMNWHYSRCATVAPDWQCVFHNSDGDRQTVTIKASLLGEAHAAIAVTLDLTEFPGAAVTYAREFADAWRDGNTYRMLRLADDDVAEELAGDTEPAAGYLACGDVAAGSTYVRIYGAGGPEYVLRVSNTALGHPDAITDSVPPPEDPACFAVVLPPSLILPTLIVPGG